MRPWSLVQGGFARTNPREVKDDVAFCAYANSLEAALATERAKANTWEDWQKLMETANANAAEAIRQRDAERATAEALATALADSLQSWDCTCGEEGHLINDPQTDWCRWHAAQKLVTDYRSSRPQSFRGKDHQEAQEGREDRRND